MAGAADSDIHDVVIVGGGTAGPVLAGRLSEDPDVRVCLVEGGPSDVGDERVLRPRNRLGLLESEFDYDYGTVPQPRGNSHIRYAAGRCSAGAPSLDARGSGTEWMGGHACRPTT
ncbi:MULTISPECIES: lycopene cyclase family protein [Catenuloplanes]|uniref:Choline dehydrogenase-like flavoprotein n=1 Tax=Catenuloplanes niger TaxID=587534 RepID=A0AAE3ZLB3_9ACTN|nr:choline dehydrogenase-like flavoprotein [Catenuloplanes niger]